MRMFLAIAFLLSCYILSAQVVNIEQKRLNNKKNGWQGYVDLNINLIHNTNDIFQGGNSFKIQHHKDQSTYLFLNDISLMSVNGDNLINNRFHHVRYNYDFKDSIFIVEGFTQIQANQIQKLRNRFLWGGGFRYRIFDTKKVRFFAGTAGMYEFEMLSLTDTAGAEFLQSEETFRISSYLSFGLKMNDVLSVNHITYYQPKIVDFEDYRISTETSFNFKITKNWTFKSFFSLFYDAQPPDEVPNVFYSLKNGIRYSF